MTSSSPARRRRGLPRAALGVATGLLALTACSGGGEEEADERTPEEVLSAAAERLADTSGVELSLTTDDLPDGVTGITSAVGVATDAPAFQGDLEVRLSGNEFGVPVVAVDGTVWARIPLTPAWSDVDPADYGAPDPAGLISDDRGFGTLLGATESPERGETIRGGEDNSEVLTEYSGTIPGEVMANVIPSSTGEEFEATYLVSEDDELREAELTGVFYADSEEMTYTVSLREYGLQQEIVAP